MLLLVAVLVIAMAVVVDGCSWFVAVGFVTAASCPAPLIGLPAWAAATLAREQSRSAAVK